MARSSRPTYDIRPRRWPMVASCAAAAALVALGLVVGGLIGWVGVVVFASVLLFSVYELVTAGAVVQVDTLGVAVGARRGPKDHVAWAEVAAVLMWTRAGRRPEDMFAAITRDEAARLHAPSERGEPRREQRRGTRPPGDVRTAASDLPRALMARSDQSFDAGAAFAHTTTLKGCELDAWELRAVLSALRQDVPVVDRRTG